MSLDNFEYTTKRAPAQNPGVYRCMILLAEKAVSSKGNNMITVYFRPSETALSIRTFFVDNEYFDQDISQFMDAFPEIKDITTGKLEPERWRGAVGCIRLKVNTNGYLECANQRYLIPATSEEAQDLPPFIWKARSDEAPEKPVFGAASVPVRSAELNELPDDLDIPF